jgi:hypothetical protein
MRPDVGGWILWWIVSAWPSLSEPVRRAMLAWSVEHRQSTGHGNR